MPNVNFNPNPSLYPDPTGRARRIIKFVQSLRLWEGKEFAGERFKIHPFQEAIIRRIYGPSDQDGNRLASIVNIWIPRGNAKTTLASALGLAHFMGPEAEAGGQVIIAAADRGNANIAFNSGWQMVQQDSELLKRVNPIVSQKELHHLKTKSFFKAISTESYSKHGLNVSFFLADELHAWPAAEARKLWKVITDSMIKRTNALTIVISTAGEGMGGLAYDFWEYSHQIMRGEIVDPSFVPIIFAAEEGMDWRSEETWDYANPGIKAGFISVKELRQKVKRAEFFPTDAADFKRFHLNLWVEGSATPWIDMTEVYDKCQERTEIEIIQKENRPGWVGVDLSSVEDLTCVSAVFPDPESQAFDIFAMFFLPEESLAKKGDRDKASYLKWISEGVLTLTPGNRVDQKVVHEHVVKLYQDFNIQEVAVDRWNSTAFVTELQEAGVEVIEFPQDFGSMAGPVKEIKRSILDGKFRHGGNLGLRSCFANVVTEKNAAENEKFTKAKARGRIDGATATAEAIGRILAHESESLNKQYRGYFSKKEVIEKILGEKEEEEEVDDGSWSPEILKDRSHPLFDVHRVRFEKWSRRQERLEERVW